MAYRTLIKSEKKKMFDFLYLSLFLSYFDAGIEEKNALFSKPPKGITDEDEKACGTEVDPLGICVRS